ncbi:unnamed protein product [Rhizophagus irregularis]|nr:unnamed protein product [Rhizophagus irregularis]
MDWQNKTQVLLRIPPHGRNYDNYPDGDLYGLTAESVSEKLQSKDILYFFGKITDYTEKMLQIFHSIIGEFPVFDLAGRDPIKLIDKIVKATSVLIYYLCHLTD